MKGILADLLIKLGLDSKGFEQGIDKAKQKTDFFGNGIKKIGGLIAGVFAVDAILQFGKHVLQLAKESIKVENELSAAIRANGKDVKSTLRDYEKFTSEIMKISNVDDEAISGMLRLAETLQSKAPKEAARNAIALSKAIGVDLNTAVKMAVMAQSDMYTMLGRYVPALREAGTAAERTAAYNKLLASGLAIMTDEVNNNIGKAEQNAIAWDNIKESWGKAILQSNLLTKALDGTKKQLDILSDSQKIYGSSSIGFWDKFLAFIDMSGNKRRELEHKIWLENKALDENSKATKQNTDIRIESVQTDEELEAAKKAAFESWEKENEAIQNQIELLQLLDDSKAKSLKSLTDKYNPSLGLGKDKEVPNTVSGMLNPEQEQDLGFNTEAYKKQLENFAEFKQQFAYMVEDFGVNVIDQFGESMGEFMATGNFPADFGKNILSIIGGFISQLGKMLIGLGVASEAFQVLLKSAFVSPIGAAVAIAAGAGLVLLGGALQGAAKAGPNSSSSASGSGGYSVSSQSYSKTNNGSYQGSNKNGVIELQAVLKGDSIFLSNQRNSYKRSVVG